MTPKLRPIRTASRSATVKRSEVTSAVKAAIVLRQSRTGQFADRSGEGKRSSSGSRK